MKADTHSSKRLTQHGTRPHRDENWSAQREASLLIEIFSAGAWVIHSPLYPLSSSENTLSGGP